MIDVLKLHERAEIGKNWKWANYHIMKPNPFVQSRISRARYDSEEEAAKSWEQSLKEFKLKHDSHIFFDLWVTTIQIQVKP